jgi:hypothetical protein
LSFLLDRKQILEAANVWMRQRDWHRKSAKKLAYEQSLLEHSLIEVDVLLTLMPLLSQPNHFGLTEREQRTLVVSVLVHDVGKEADAWQKYLLCRETSPRVGHISLDLAREAAPEVCALLGFDDLPADAITVIENCSQFHHHRPGQSDAAIMKSMVGGGTDRFLTLANLIKALDHLCSADGSAAAVRALQSDPSLSPHLQTSRHEVTMRGVSTVLLHAACQAAFEESGWQPLLYFSTGTVYFADKAKDVKQPEEREFATNLERQLDEAISKDVASLVVGIPTANMLPKPDLVDYAEARNYLWVAAKRIGPQSFAKKILKDRKKVIQDYGKLRLGENNKELPQGDLGRESERISIARPEMVVFKFFKALFDDSKVPTLTKGCLDACSKMYDSTFGSGAWQRLQGTSTLMAAKEMCNVIDPWWSLNAQNFDPTRSGLIEDLPSIDRINILIESLSSIVGQVRKSESLLSPRKKLAAEMSSAFLNDIVHPKSNVDWIEIAREQQKHYAESKVLAGKDPGKKSTETKYLCPMCNLAMTGDTAKKASADFIANPESHTNRAVSHGGFDAIRVCTTCYFERLLIQTVCGKKPDEMIVLLPRLNFGPVRGAEIISKVKRWVELAQRQMMAEDNQGLDVSLGYIENAAGRLSLRDPALLSEGELLDLFLVRVPPDKQKNRLKDAAKLLQEEFDDSIDDMNLRAGSTFSSWSDAAQTVLDGTLHVQEFEMVRRAILSESIFIACQTPNMILLPLTRPIAAGSKDSDSGKALRRLYISLILSSAFDAAVCISSERDLPSLTSDIGSAYVPPIPSIRALTGCNWIPLQDVWRWINAIGAASRLVHATGLPERNALYQILSCSPAEWLARRIEQAGNSPSLLHLQLIERLPGFTGLHREENQKR